MMDPEHVEALRAELQRVKPKRLVVLRGEDEARRIVVPETKKRWDTCLTILARLDFSRIEMHDRAGGLVGVWDAPVADDAPAPARGADPADARDERVMRLLMTAQKYAVDGFASYVAVMFDGMSKTLGVLTAAVEQLSSTQRATLDAQAAAFNAQLVAATAGGAGGAGDLESAALLEKLLPMLVARMLPPGAPAPAPRKDKTDATS